MNRRGFFGAMLGVGAASVVKRSVLADAVNPVATKTVVINCGQPVSSKELVDMIARAVKRNEHGVGESLRAALNPTRAI